MSGDVTGDARGGMGEAGPLSAAEQALLRRLAGVMLPASATYRVPGADDAAIQADILATLGRDAGHVRAALALFRAAAEQAADDAAAQRVLGSGREEIATLGRVVLAAYYRDDRVLRSLEMEARSPFPNGHVVEQGDWSLLDVVREKPKLWRDAPR